MLTSIGKISKSVLLKILVGIIILPFIFWGMGDVFRGGNQNILAKIDSDKVTTQEFFNYLNKLNLSENDLKNINKTNLVDQILSEYIGKKIISLEVNDLGIKLTDKALKDIIVNDETFFKDGKFSRTEYEFFLIKNSLSAPFFEKNLAEQEKKRQLLSFLSEGFPIPTYYVDEEFKKENQIKDIQYLDLSSIYKKEDVKIDEIKKIYSENKSFFTDRFKKLSYSELTPNILIGKNDFDKSFFEKINDIENNALDGISMQNISQKYNLQIKETELLNKNQLNTVGKKNERIKKKLFDKFFLIKNIKQPELINHDQKYYLVEVTSVDEKQKNLEDPDVSDVIKSQIVLEKKINNNSKLAKEIALGNFKKEDMKKIANENNINIQNARINGLKEDHKVFNKDILKRILETEDGEFNVVTDGLMAKNFIIFSEKSEASKIDKKSADYEKYSSLAKLNFARNFYGIYDNGVNKKYNVEVNNKALDRVKNSF